ncbi:MAG: nucleotidyltransferase domain-containing protein [Bacteroidetes bacterium]|jgi:predicted nucleotidyltransferase|nr:nucleotidyltransferase domain-containing protein [Bacteroidota bacterium]
MDQKEVINKVRQYKALLQNHFDVDRVYLFGSYLLGTNRKDSDIDVAIILNHVEEDYFSVTPVFWKLRHEVDDRIEPILIEKDNDRSGFLKEIEKWGIEI